MMKKYIVSAMCFLFFVACMQEKKQTSKTVLNDEIEIVVDDWQILFNGTSLDQWKEYKTDGISDAWRIEGDALVYMPPEDEGHKNHDLVTRQEFTNFVLTLDWKISEAGNSGVFWGISEDEKFGTGYQTGPEIQILDNHKHPDAMVGTNRQAGALYDMVSPSKDVTKPIGEWNTMTISVNHKEQKGSVILNGIETVTFPLANEEWNAMVATSKFAEWDGFGDYTTGKIGLQDHDNKVWFRNIKIKQL